MKNSVLLARQHSAIARGVAITCDFFADKAYNAELWDVEGKRYIDFAAGIAVLNTGHRHPRLVEAMQAQLNAFTHTSFQTVPYESYVSLAERINGRVPISGCKKTALFTTGAEAVENAIKIARAATGRPGVIAFSGAFHGRTMMGMALTGKVAPYKLGFGPLPAEVYHAPFPNKARGVTVDDSVKAIDELFRSDIDPRRVAAIIFEPVQGEGGFNVMPAELAKHLREICNAHGILLIADEVQTGFGRTGKLFAVEHLGISPDMITMAKSLAGGMPLSAVCGRADVMDAPAPGGLGGTYAGNPLAVASALAVIDIIDAEGLLERAMEIGSKLKHTLEVARVKNQYISDVRGLGAMIGVEFHDPQTGLPSPDYARLVQRRALESGLILLTCGTHGNVIRLLCPLTIGEQVLHEAQEILASSMSLEDNAPR